MTRTILLTIAGLALAAAALATPARAEGPVDPQRQMIREEIDAYLQSQKSDFRVYWKEGLNFETPDKNFTIGISGRIQLDSVFYDDNEDRKTFNEVGKDLFHSGAEFRRVWVDMHGKMYKYGVFKVELELAALHEDSIEDTRFLTDAFEFRDVYLGLHNLDKCWGCAFPDITVGHFKEYFALEELTSSRFITFMERSLPINAFVAPYLSYNIGVGLKKGLWGNRFLYSLGWWTDTPAFGNRLPYFKDRGQNLTGRLVFMPWAPCDCETRFWEIGGSVSYQFDNPNGWRFRTRPEIHLADRIADVRVQDSDSALFYGVESAFVFDRFKLQGEYIGVQCNVDGGDDPTFWGSYVQVAYLLGGRGFGYDRSSQTFSKIRPCNNFDCTQCGHLGAVEFAARWSHIDLTDGGYTGGEADDFTIGINWYLNPNAKVMVNYVYSDVTAFQGNAGVDGTLNMFGVSFRVFW